MPIFLYYISSMKAKAGTIFVREKERLILTKLILLAKGGHVSQDSKTSESICKFPLRD